MEPLSRLWKVVTSHIGCKRSRLSLTDLPQGLSWGKVVQSGLRLLISFEEGTVLVDTNGAGFGVWEGMEVSYFAHEEYACLSFGEMVGKRERVRVVERFEEVLILMFFDQLDYFNLPVSLISHIDGQLELGGTAILTPLFPGFSLQSTGKTHRSLRSPSLPSLNPAKHSTGLIWEATIPPFAKLAVGVHRETLDDLQKTDKKNKKFKRQIEGLKEAIAGWRQVRGDGNCYYRAVGVAFLEHLARKSTSETELWAFKAKVAKATGSFAVNPGFETVHSHFGVLLDRLLTYKLSNPGASLHLLQSLLQTPEFDQSVHLMMRNYCYNGVAQSGRSLEAFQTEQGIRMEEILMPGVEAEGVALVGLPEALSAAILHYIIDGKSAQTYIEKYLPHHDYSKIPILLLAYFPGHYDLLYSHVQSGVDGYSFDTHTYDVSEQYEYSLVADLYLDIS